MIVWDALIGKLKKIVVLIEKVFYVVGSIETVPEIIIGSKDDRADSVDLE